MRISVAVLTMSSLLLFGCGGGHEPKQASADAKTPVAVQTLAVSEVDWPAVYEAVGTVRARTAAVISAKMMGYVREVNVQAGDRVREGQLLIVLDSRDLEAGYLQAQAGREEARSVLPEVENAIAAAKANLELTEITFGRMKGLFEKKSISNQEFDEASAKLSVARANYEMAVARRAQLVSKIEQAEQALRAAEVMRGFGQIAAPFSGIITEKSVEPGNLAAPGAPLLTIERDGAFRLEAAVEESRLGAVRAGQKVSVSLEALDRTLEGRVSEIVPAVDSASRSFTVKIELPASPHVRSGVFGRARFPVGSRQVLAVPSAAVIERGQLQSVLVADGGLARARLVRLGRHSGSQVEVLSGLNPGDEVIFPVPAGLADGAAVEVRP